MATGERLSLDCVLRVPEHVLMRRVGEEMVMLNFEDEIYYGLNEVGMRLMQLSAGGASLRSILESLAGEFDVERVALEADVRRVAQDLIAAKLLAREAP